MFGVFYIFNWLLSSIKSIIKDNIDDVHGRINRHINERVYVKNTTPMDMQSGHPVINCGDHKYQDLITRKYFRTPITEDDIRREELSQEEARRWNHTTYKISGARLPVGTEGTGYKDFHSDRMYVSRYIGKTAINDYHNIKSGTFLISINSDNYGQIEKFYGGRSLTQPYIEAFKDLIIDPNNKGGNNGKFIWKIK